MGGDSVSQLNRATKHTLSDKGIDNRARYLSTPEAR
jgi:hypothetical protein